MSKVNGENRYLCRQQMGKKIIIAVTNDLSGDQRIHRIASSLAERGFDVLVIGRKLAGSLPLNRSSYQTYRMQLWFTRGKWFYLEYNFRLFFYLLFKPVDIINSNDLDTLLACYCASVLKRKKLVYDSHEYFTEVPELIKRPATRKAWLILERMIFPRLKSVYTVNHKLAEVYSGQYGIPVGMIRNLPFRKYVPVSAEKQNILLYQGALNLGRGIELMIDAMKFLPGYKLWIIGRGDVENALKERAAKIEPGRVEFMGFMPLEKLGEYTRQARLGLSLEEDMGANYRYSSPNKVYDYIQAGVPVLVSDLPVMKKIVEEYGVGKVWEAEQRTAGALAATIKEMMENTSACVEWVKNCRTAAEILNWEEEEKKLSEFYH